MEVVITVETEMFNSREVKPHLINPCCFGEDFAAWLKDAISPVAHSGFELSKIIQEDYGWGFWASHGKDPFWIAISCVTDEAPEPAPQWVISVNYDAGLSVMKRLFHKPDRQALEQLRDHILQALRSERRIRILPDEQRHE